MEQSNEKRQEPTTATVARRVAEIRRRRGISAQDLAERCAAAGWPGLDRGILANLESGRRRSVSIDEVLVLALVLDVAPVHLFVPLDDDELVELGQVKSAADLFREWVRGEKPLTGQDRRTYWTEVPDAEWEAFEEAQPRVARAYKVEE